MFAIIFTLTAFVPATIDPSKIVKELQARCKSWSTFRVKSLSYKLLTKLPTGVCTGEFIVFYKHPDRWRLEVTQLRPKRKKEIKVLKKSEIVNKPFLERELAFMQRGTTVHLSICQILENPSDFSINFLGTKRLQNREVFLLKVKPKRTGEKITSQFGFGFYMLWAGLGSVGGESEILYVDAKTLLPLQEVFYINGSQEIGRIIYSKFTKVKDNEYIPLQIIAYTTGRRYNPKWHLNFLYLEEHTLWLFKEGTVFTNGKITGTATIEDVKINYPLKDSLFE